MINVYERVIIVFIEIFVVHIISSVYDIMYIGVNQMKLNIFLNRRKIDFHGHRKVLSYFFFPPEKKSLRQENSFLQKLK